MIIPASQNDYAAGFADGYRQGKKDAERKRGHWIGAECRNGMTERRCSECNCFAGYGVSSLPWFNFCPWCGADMRGGNNGND